MAKIDNKWLRDDAVDGSKVKLANDESLRARNAGDSADVNMFKLDSSDEVLFEVVPKFAPAPTADEQLANKKYVDDTLGSLGSAVQYIANFDPTSTTLADGVGTLGDLYNATVAGSKDFGSGAISFNVGDKAVYNLAGVWEKWDNTDPVDTDEIAEGASNFYYTEGRFDTSFGGKDTDDLTEGTAKFVTAADVTKLGNISVTAPVDLDGVEALAESAVQPADNISTLTNDSAFVDAAGAKTASVVNSTAGSETDQAASVAAMKTYVGDEIAAADSAIAFTSEAFSIDGTDVSNGYVDLSLEAVTGSETVHPKDGPVQVLTDDYSLSKPALVTRVTFAGDLLDLAIGDKLIVKYAYEV